MTDDYTPSEDDVRNVYVDYLMRHTSKLASVAEAEFDRFIAQVKRDAAREALDGLIDAWLGKYGTPETQDAGIAVRDYRETNYRLPEEAP